MSRRIILQDESYLLNGIFYRIHNRLGRFLLEKQYADALEIELKELGIPYEREKRLALNYDDSVIASGVVDFIIQGKIAVDLKAKKFITKEDYFHRNTYLKPKRVLNSALRR